MKKYTIWLILGLHRYTISDMVLLLLLYIATDVYYAVSIWQVFFTFFKTFVTTK